MDKLAIAHADEPPEVTEMCPSCGKEVTLIWDTEKDGYKAFCPNCGQKLDWRTDNGNGMDQR